MLSSVKFHGRDHRHFARLPCQDADDLRVELGVVLAELFVHHADAPTLNLFRHHLPFTLSDAALRTARSLVHGTANSLGDLLTQVLNALLGFFLQRLPPLEEAVRPMTAGRP